MAVHKEPLCNLTLLLLRCKDMRAHVQKSNDTGIVFPTTQNKQWSSEKKEKKTKRGQVIEFHVSQLSRSAF